jgi:hypothetical protein
MGIAGGLIIQLVFPVGKAESAIPSIKVPGAYPYEETVSVPVPTISESPVLPTPAPFLYRESSPAFSASQDRDSRTANARRPLTPKAVREAAFKYNGVPYFCEFLAALPADVSVFDPKLGTTRTLIKGGRVLQKNVAWLRKRKQGHVTSNDRTLVSTEELGARNSGI